MKRNVVGGTQVEVTAMGLGTAQLGDLYQTMSDEMAADIVDEAWAMGIRYFDTAPLYGRGLAERRLGAALRSRTPGTYALSTKVGPIVEDTDQDKDRPVEWDFSADAVRRSIEQSLGRLHVDSIDIVLIHDPEDDMASALDEAYPALEQLRDEKVIRAIGVGTRVVHALETFVARTNVDAVMVAGRYTLLNQEASRGLIPLCKDRGVSILNAGIFNSGLLADPRPSVHSKYEYRAASEPELARARLAASIARRHGLTLAHAALSFATTAPQVASVVVGADSARQVKSNVALLNESPPPPELWADLREAELLADASGF